jgi:hypothetical protein
MMPIFYNSENVLTVNFVNRLSYHFGGGMPAFETAKQVPNDYKSYVYENNGWVLFDRHISFPGRDKNIDTCRKCFELVKEFKQ